MKVEGIQHPVIVVSNDYFNQSGRAIVCPILKKAAPGPLHIQLRETEVDGYVLCEQVRYLDLTARRFSKLSATHYFDIMDISDAVVGMFRIPVASRPGPHILPDLVDIASAGPFLFGLPRRFPRPDAEEAGHVHAVDLVHAPAASRAASCRWNR